LNADRRVKIAPLAAYGVDPATVARWLLDWEPAPGEPEPPADLWTEALEAGLLAA
jgi:hypothetical protein